MQDGMTPLIIAAINHENEMVAGVLLDAGAATETTGKVCCWGQQHTCAKFSTLASPNRHSHRYRMRFQDKEAQRVGTGPVAGVWL